MNASDFPKYKSHKTVGAAEIVGWNQPDQTGDATIDVVVEGLRSTITVPSSIFARGEPAAGDFLVVYEDGYLSFSPRQAFLDGYTALDAVADPQPATTETPVDPSDHHAVIEKCHEQIQTSLKALGADGSDAMRRVAQLFDQSIHLFRAEVG